MLNAMSKILLFDEKEKNELGLNKVHAPKMGLSLVNFLMGGGDEEDHL